MASAVLSPRLLPPTATVTKPGCFATAWAIFVPDASVIPLPTNTKCCSCVFLLKACAVDAPQSSSMFSCVKRTPTRHKSSLANRASVSNLSLNIAAAPELFDFEGDVEPLGTGSAARPLASCEQRGKRRISGSSARSKTSICCPVLSRGISFDPWSASTDACILSCSFFWCSLSTLIDASTY